MPDTLLSDREIRDWRPDPLPANRDDAMARARLATQRAGCGGPGQQLGERWPIGCVALEITQRCNLDCTLCYLSEHSEAVHDLPLAEIFRRIDRIRAHYGTGIDVQVTGGDPTLRDHDELLAIVRRLREHGQRATLMTNGIRAQRPLMLALRRAGLSDVAFHVDTTQQRSGYASERDLDEVRLRYIEAAGGLGLSVMFNTTVHAGNVHEVAHLAAFFREHADVVRTASFQLHADTGRGALRERGAAVSASGVWAAIEHGLGTTLDTGTVRVGHEGCTRYGLCTVVNGRARDLLGERALITAVQRASADLLIERGRPLAVARTFAPWLLTHPRWLARGVAWAAAHLARGAWDLLAARGRVHTLSFVSHDFMHACSLERDRIEACVFKVMTAEGPVSMCLHNARRDDFITRPVTLVDGRVFDPLHGRRGGSVAVALPDPKTHGRKRARGRTRQQLLEQGEALMNTGRRRWPRMLAVVLLPLLAAACASQVRVPASAPPADSDRAMAHWARVLERFVDTQGRVDFHGLAMERGDLDAYVAWIAAVSPASHPAGFTTDAARLAHHINAYNALSMYNVLEAGLPGDLYGLAKLDFFVLRKLTIGGQPTSLYDYENDVIRPLGEPRVHFALNCMAVSCPRLPREPFRAQTLDNSLDAETHRFFAEARNLSIDDSAHTVTFNEILDFYTEDFLAVAPSLQAYASRYREAPVPEDFAVRFAPYDWRVNHQP